jgi:hypothetical protein
MKIFKKSAINIATTAAVLGAVIATNQVSALPAGSVGDAQPAVAAGDPYVNPNGLGQALIFPYYSVRNGLKSLFNITNTANYAVAVKVRFHEGHNSRDALDFNIVLSPEDVWTGWIEDSASGPVVMTDDNSCVVGAPDIKTTGQALSNVAYGTTVPSFQDEGDNSIERTREGYVEVIAMGKAYAAAVGVSGTTTALATLAEATAGAVYSPAAAATGNTAYYATHQANGNPRDCSIVDGNFLAPTTAPQTLPVSFPFVDTGTADLGDGDPIAAGEFSALAATENPLKGNFSIINAGTGIGAGNAAVAIADFMDAVVIAADASKANDNLITAQNFPYFLEPSLASRDGIWTNTGLVDVDAGLMSASIVNEWAQNTATGAVTDWVVTFPTKGFHVDNEVRDGTDFVKSTAASATQQNIQAASNQWRTGALATQIVSDPFQDNIDNNGAAVGVGILGYNREEQGVTATLGNTTPSPFPPGGVTALSLQGEANLISFSPAGTASALGGQNFVLNFDVSATLANPAPNGWAQVTFNDVAGGGTTLPVVGYAFKSRNQGDATLSFGQVLNHAWK